MKRIGYARILCLLLAAVILCPTAALAGVMYDLSVSNPTYYDGNGSVKTLDTAFCWVGADATSRLVLSTKKLDSDQLTNLGYYGTMYDTFEEAVEADKADGLFGILNHSNECLLEFYSDNKITFTFKETDIPLDTNQDYYIYLWSYYQGHYYPDYAITTLRVEDEQLYYTNAGGELEPVGSSGNAINGGTPQPGGSPIEPSGSSTSVPVSSVPRTGDEFNFVLCAALACMSLTGVILLIRKQRKA